MLLLQVVSFISFVFVVSEYFLLGSVVLFPFSGFSFTSEYCSFSGSIQDHCHCSCLRVQSCTTLTQEDRASWCKNFKKTTLIKNMFTSDLEIARFESAAVQTASGIKGQVKKVCILETIRTFFIFYFCLVLLEAQLQLFFFGRHCLACNIIGEFFPN